MTDTKKPDAERKLILSTVQLWEYRSRSKEIPTTKHGQDRQNAVNKERQRVIEVIRAALSQPAPVADAERMRALDENDEPTIEQRLASMQNFYRCIQAVLADVEDDRPQKSASYGLRGTAKGKILALKEKNAALSKSQPPSSEIDDEGLGLAHYSTVKQLMSRTHGMAAEIISLKIQLGTEQVMHKAWRKRAEEAEAMISAAHATDSKENDGS